MLRLALVVLVLYSATSYGVPVNKDFLTPEDVFYRSLEPDERKALMQMGIESAVVERGIQTTEVKLTVPETLRHSISAKTDPDFQNKLIAWIGREWNLTNQALLDLHMNGRGCREDGTCVNVYDMDHTCCPFG